MKKLSSSFSALVLALGLVAAGGAHATLLSDLLNGGSIQAGDKLFDNWSVTFNQVSNFNDPNRTAINAANIDVTALNDGGMNPGPGLQFTVLNNEFSITGDDIYAYIDFTFGFRATVLTPGLKIKDNSLTITNGLISYNSDQSNDNGMYIHENVGTAAGLADLGTKAVEFSVLNDALTSNLTDSAAFAPQSQIWVTKNILVWATDSTDSASLLGFSQRFSQSQVPEPATLALMGLGLAGLAAARRRKASA